MVEEKKGGKEKVFLNQRYFDTDFSGKDLTHADFRGSKLVNCNFSNADLSYANFEGANLYRSKFLDANLYHASFKDAVLLQTEMNPKSFFGVTISLTEDSFSGASMDGNFALYLLHLVQLAKLPGNLQERIKTMLVEEIGQEKLDTLGKVSSGR